MTAKSAAVFALDVRCPAAGLEKGKQILMTTIIDKMLYAPRDEVALVLSGTNDTLNPLHTQSNGARYQHVTVCNPLCAATTDCLQPLYNLEELARHSDKGKSDFLDTLIVCLALLHDHIGTKKYKRVVYLITDAREEVARREELNEVSQSLRADDVTLVVVGVDFTETSSDMSDFTSLSIKAQNERVLHFLCSSVGNASQVLSVEDTLQGVSQLRARKILQRPLLKVVLTIGDIRLAVQMFSKAQEEKFPTLKRVTTDGVGVGMASEYVRVGGEEHQGPIQPGDHVKAFRYGRGLIPCTEADLDAMKLHGLRSLEAVAFVPREEVPPYILMGGVKAILPLAGDHTGQKGFACIVRSMLELNRVLIVRHVRTRDAAPSLAVCFPSDQDGDCLYFAPLPFSEDVRPFRFSNYEEVQCTAAEERMIDNMIDALTVEETVLMPSETFNPSLQQYYGTLRSKLMSKEESDVPPLLPTLQASSTAFNAFGNPLQPVLEKALPVLDKVAAAFPFAEVDPAKAGDRRSHWFRLSSGVTPDGQDDNSTSDRAPSTVNAFLLKSKNGAKTGEGSVVSTSDVSTIAAEGLATTVKHVTTVDPVGSFEALLANAKQDGVARLTAMDEITEVILQLLRYSLKSAHYDKCDDALQALRQCCVHENDPDYYNSFLMKLSVETREMGRWDDYFDGRLMKSKKLRPITVAECSNSALKNDADAKAFLLQDRSVPVLDVEDAVDDDLLDLIS